MASSQAMSEVYAAAMIECIKLELPDAAYFTREDLLHLSVFSHVATITRYQYVCAAVRYSLNRKWLLEMNRTDLILVGGKRAYGSAIVNVDEYAATIAKIVKRMPISGFTVMDVLNEWTSDHHLTLNAKRVAVRAALRRMVSRGYLSMATFSLYVVETHDE